jgi:sporulation protein YlmC with PRC-barrel domain
MGMTPDQINVIYDAVVVTSDGHDIGGVGQIYLDDETARPSWVSVKTGWFGLRENLVPLDRAEMVGGRIRVPHTQEVVRAAPHVDAHEHLGEDEQRELSRYYARSSDDGPEDLVTPGATDEARFRRLRRHQPGPSDGPAR